METKAILNIILLVLIIILWNWVFIVNKSHKSINLLPYRFKNIGIVFLVTSILLLILTNESYNGVSFYIGAYGGLIISLTREKKETINDYNRVRYISLLNTLKYVFPLIIIIGIVNMLIIDKAYNIQDVTLYTPSTIFLLIIGYLIMFYSQKKKVNK